MNKEELKNQEYKYGFTTDIENFKAPKGLSEETIRFISKAATQNTVLISFPIILFLIIYLFLSNKFNLQISKK